MFLTPRITTLSRAVAQACDPYWNQVVLLLTGDDFVDHSPAPITVSPSGDVAIARDQPISGGGAYSFGSNGYLTLSAGSVPDRFDFSDVDFTFECWLYYGVKGQSTLFTARDDYTGAAGLGIWTDLNGGLALLVGSTGVYSTETLFQVGAYNHVEVAKSGGVITGRINGVFACSTTASIVTPSGNASIYGVRVAATNATYNVGNHSFVNTHRLAWMRITKGVARHTADFTPPTAPFPSVQC